jgi:hypothetical protein
MASKIESEPPITRKARNEEDESRPLVHSRAGSSSWIESLQLNNPKVWIAIGLTVALFVTVSVDPHVFPIFSDAQMMFSTLWSLGEKEAP